MYIDHYGRLISSDELYHHGILGMHWGIRRYQPYPSDYHGDGKYTGARGRNEQTDHTVSKAKLKKAVKVGSKIAVGCLLAYGGYKLSSSPAVRNLVSEGMKKFNKAPSIEEMIEKSGPEIVKKTDKMMGDISKTVVPKVQSQKAFNTSYDRFIKDNPGIKEGYPEYVARQYYNSYRMQGKKYGGNFDAFLKDFPEYKGVPTYIARQFYDNFKKGNHLYDYYKKQ